MIAEFVIVKIKDVAEIYSGNSINEKVKDEKYSDLDDGIDYISTKDIGFDSSINYDNGIKIPYNEAQNFKRAPKDTVFICAEGGSAGRKIAISDRELCFVNKLFAVVARNTALPKYLYYYLKSEEFIEQFKGSMTGIIGGVSINKFKEIDIKIPSLVTQQKIVEKLDAIFCEIDRATMATEAIVNNVEALFQSHLNNLISKNEDDFFVWELGDKNLLEIIDGDRGSNYPNKSDFSEDGYCLFLNTKNVLKNGFSFDEKMFISELKSSQLRKGKLVRNDVVLTTRGTLGNVAWYSNEVPYEHVRINSGMLILRSNNKIILPEFLFEVLRSNIIQSEIKLNKSGAAQPQLPIHTLRHFKLPVPISLDIQRNYVALIQSFQNHTSQLKRSSENKHNEIINLKKSILKQAFNGELVKE